MSSAALVDHVVAAKKLLWHVLALQFAA